MVRIYVPLPKDGQGRGQLSRNHSTRISATVEWIIGTLERVTVSSRNLKYSFQTNAYLEVGQDREEAL